MSDCKGCVGIVPLSNRDYFMRCCIQQLVITFCKTCNRFLEQNTWWDLLTIRWLQAEPSLANPRPGAKHFCLAFFKKVVFPENFLKSSRKKLCSEKLWWSHFTSKHANYLRDFYSPGLSLSLFLMYATCYSVWRIEIRNKYDLWWLSKIFHFNF